MKRLFFSVMMTMVLVLSLGLVTATPVSAVVFDLEVNDLNPWEDEAFIFEDILPGGEPMEFNFKLHNVGDSPGTLTFSMSVVENDMAGAPLLNMSADEFASLIYVEDVHYQYIWLDHPDHQPDGYIGSVRNDLESWLGMDANSDGKVSLYEICQIPAIPYGDYEGDQLEAGAEITYFIEFQLGGSLDGGVAGGAILTGVEDDASQGDGVSVTITANLGTDEEQSSGNVFQAGIPSVIDLGTTIDEDLVSISLTTNSIDFGSVYPGDTAVDSFTITNEGTVRVVLTAETTPPDGFFAGKLKVNTISLDSWIDSIDEGGNLPVTLLLTVPHGTPAGVQTGLLIIWVERSEDQS